MQREKLTYQSQNKDFSFSVKDKEIQTPLFLLCLLALTYINCLTVGFSVLHLPELPLKMTTSHYCPMLTILRLLCLCSRTHPRPASVDTDTQPTSGFEERYHENPNDLQEQSV